MIKRIVFGAALALAIVGISAPDASAFCNPPKFVASFNSVSGEYTYWQVNDNTNSAALATKFINNNQDVGGTCQFLYWAVSPGQVGLSGDFGQACALGTPCPSGTLSLIGQAGDSFFGATITEGTGALGYDFAPVGGPGHVKETGSAPRPRVTSSSRSGSSVIVSIGIDAVSSNPGFDAATAATITGYNILSAAATTDPGRSAVAYQPLANAPASGGGPGSVASASVDCTNTALDRWVVTQIVTTGGPFHSVSAATQIKCNPALADPKYKKVPAPKKANPGDDRGQN